jgi:transposase
MKQDYDQKRSVAKHMFIDQNKTAKEIAGVLSISQKTVGEWCKKYNWKQEKEMREVAAPKRTENLQCILDDMATKRIALTADIAVAEAAKDTETVDKLRKEISGIDVSVAAWNKRLQQADKEGKVTNIQYIQVMDKFFEALAQYDYQLYLKTVPFQEVHLAEVSTRKTL